MKNIINMIEEVSKDNYQDNINNEEVIIDEKHSEEIARIGYVDDFEVFICTDDGNIPHFHSRDRNTKGEIFHTCIRLDSPKYFHHTGKENILSDKQKKDLMIFLSEINKYSKSTNWKTLIALWNMNNSNKLPLDLKMPNYIELP